MLAKTLLSLAALIATPLTAAADVLDTSNKLVIQFSVDSNWSPYTPNELILYLGQVEVLSPITSRNAAMYDGPELLGVAIETNFGGHSGPLSLNPSNSFIKEGVAGDFGNPGAIRFDSIQNGTIDGRIELTVTTGAMDVDPNTVSFKVIRHLGQSNFATGPAPVATSVQLVSRAPSGTAACFGDGTSTACPCGTPGPAGHGCPNGFTQGALLGGFGSPSVGDDTLQLIARDCVRNVPGLLFSSSSVSAASPFGNGLLCSSGALTRFPVVITDSTGSVIVTPELSVLEGLQAGDLRRYQFWFRDPFGPCGGGFNTTNAFDVQW